MKKLLILSILFLSNNLFSQQQLNKSLFFDGLNRTYIVYIPSTYDGTSQVPVVFNFHGGGGTSSDFINYGNDMRPVADTANFIAVYPQAATDPTDGSFSWLHKAPTSHNDVNFIEAIIDTLASEYAIDNERIYACGYSEGGIFSYELGCRLNNRIASFSSVSGSMLTDSFRTSYYNLGVCSAVHPTAVLLIPGTNDFSPHSSYNGLSPYYMSVSDITTYWSNFNNTDLNPTVNQVPNINSSDGSTVERKTWENGDNCVSIEELKVIGGGHDWPGNFGNMDVNATNEIWNFVSKYNKSGLINCSALSNESIMENNVISIYPNPAKSILFISKQSQTNENYLIISSFGNIVLKGVLNESIDISNLSAGFYILKVADKAHKFFKEK
jgi:polyhydroxybutyrate depolymerase